MLSMPHCGHDHMFCQSSSRRGALCPPALISLSAYLRVPCAIERRFSWHINCCANAALAIPRSYDTFETGTFPALPLVVRREGGREEGRKGREARIWRAYLVGATFPGAESDNPDTGERGC